jgi:hypothetical protein
MHAEFQHKIIIGLFVKTFFVEVKKTNFIPAIVLARPLEQIRKLKLQPLLFLQNLENF